MKSIRRLLGMVNPARWRYTPGGAIWRVSSSHPEVLVGEERDLDAKRTRFFCLEKKTGRVRWHRQSFGEEWWIGIEAMNHDTLFLHGFTQPDMPAHQSVIAVDLNSGRELWRNSEVTLDQVFDRTILVNRPSRQGKESVELDARTGKQTDQTIFVPRTLSGDFDKDIHYPIPTASPMSQFPEYARVWQGLPPDILAGVPVEVIPHGTSVVAAYHVRTSPPDEQPPRYRQDIMAAASTGRPIFRDVIVNDTTTIVPDSFFVQGDALYFVRLRNTLVGVKLPPHE